MERSSLGTVRGFGGVCADVEGCGGEVFSAYVIISII